MVSFVEEHSKHKAAKEFKVDRKRVITWCKQKVALNGAFKSSKCLPGQGRKVRYPDIEDKLLNWLKERREKGGRVPGKALKHECLRLHRLYGSQSFKASCGLDRKFRKRNGITIRRTMHSSQKPKDITDDLITRFQRQIIRSRLARGYEPCE